MNPINLAFSPDELIILSVVENNVLLRIEDDKEKPCILSLPRDKFIQSINDWLDHKADYYDRCKEYCGVGYVLVTDCVVTGKAHLNDYISIDDENGEWDEEKSYIETLNVKIYSPFLTSEIQVDMEHG